jgi:tetratricopeptide (TPR) repeat protein
MKKLLTVALTLSIVALSRAAGAQNTAELQRMFEAGKYQQVVEAAPADAAPPVLYTTGQSHQKLGANDQAKDVYRRLADLPDNDPWHYIGLSAQQLLDGQADAAEESARRATEIAPDLAEAHYQRGLALARREDWRGAASEFDRAAELNPSNAYAHYYGGLMQYRAGRPDRMAIHFEQFLKLAPDAPERPEVLQIMRTVRGR